MDVRLSKPTLAAITALATVGGAGAARAEPGVHVDPQSPAGVEYAIPLHSGRQPGGHGTTGGRAAGSSGTLFGAGITPPSGSASKPGSRSSNSARGTHTRPDAVGGASGGRSAKAGSAGGGSAVPVSASAHYSPTAPVVALIGAILLVGGGLGLLARRRSS